MKNIVFVKVRNDQGEIYGSYLAYWELVGLSGFASCELNELGQHPAGTIYIFAPDNGNVRDVLRSDGCNHRDYKYILWQLEIPGQVEIKVPSYFDGMFVSDMHYWHLVNDDHCIYVPMGGHPDFGVDASKLQKKYDIVHMSYIYGKRAEQVAQLEAKGYTIAPVGFGEERNEIIKASKWGLCLHQHDVPILEPLRHTMFSCFNVPLIIEHCTDYYPYEGQDYIQFLQNGPNEEYLRESSQRNYEKMTQELTFRKCVEEALR